MVAQSETTILTRLLDPGRGDLDHEAAKALLRLEFRPTDVERIEELGRLSQDGALGAEERAEYESYVRVGHFLSLLHSKARLSLQQPPEPR